MLALILVAVAATAVACGVVITSMMLARMRNRPASRMPEQAPR